MSEPDLLTISIEDIVGGFGCMFGARRWANEHGIPHQFKELIETGSTSAAALLESECPLARKVCDHARMRQTIAKGTDQ